MVHLVFHADYHLEQLHRQFPIHKQQLCLMGLRWKHCFWRGNAGLVNQGQGLFSPHNTKTPTPQLILLGKLLVFYNISLYLHYKCWL